MKNKTGTIKVAKKSDNLTVEKNKAQARAKANKAKKSGINKLIPMKDSKGNVKMGTRMNGQRQAVPNLAAMRKRGMIVTMD